MSREDNDAEAVDLLTNLTSHSKGNLFHDETRENTSTCYTPSNISTSELSSDAMGEQTDEVTLQRGVKRKRDLHSHIKLIGFEKFVQDSCRKTYYMCTPGGQDGIKQCVPTWSIHKNCKQDALLKVLKYYPLMNTIVSTASCNVDGKPASMTNRDWFIENFTKLSHASMNGARSNLTRAIKRNFFQPGMTAATRQQAPNPHCGIWGKYQLAKGCLKNEQNCEVQVVFNYSLLLRLMSNPVTIVRLPTRSGLILF